MSFEKELVRLVGERIGYGRTMQLCEQLWDEKIRDGRGARDLLLHDISRAVPGMRASS